MGILKTITHLIPIYLIFQVSNEIKSQLASKPSLSKQLVMVRRQLMSSSPNLTRYDDFECVVPRTWPGFIKLNWGVWEPDQV